MDAKISKYSKACMLSGGLLLFLPNGVMWYWGNMSVYIRSYLRMTEILQSTVESPWLPSSYALGFYTGLMIAEANARVIGRKSTMLLGIIMVDGGLFCSFFTVQYSIHWLNISQGAMGGLGTGILYAMVLQQAVDFSDKNAGLFVVLLATGCSIGGAIITQIVSWYINPNNESPKLQIGPMTYFTQIDVIERVPSVYLVLGSCALTTHLIGLALLKSSQKPSDGGQIKDLGTTSSIGNDSTLTGISTDKDETSYFYSKEENISKVSRSECAMGRPVSKEDGPEICNTVNTTNIRTCYGKKIPLEDLKAVDFQKTKPNNLDFQDDQCNPKPKSLDSDISSYNNDKENTDVLSYTPREMLQHRTFYCLWILKLILSFGFVSLSTYFKTFGQLFIENDHSLSKLGTAIGVSVSLLRIPFGIVVDKLHLKNTMVFISSSMSLAFTFYYFSPMVHPWLYYPLSILMPCGDRCFYCCLAVCTLRLFGPKHMSTNFGFVSSAGILLNLGAPPLYRLLLENWGWFSLFFSIGLLYSLALLAIVLSLHKI